MQAWTRTSISWAVSGNDVYTLLPSQPWMSLLIAWGYLWLACVTWTRHVVHHKQFVIVLFADQAGSWITRAIINGSKQDKQWLQGSWSRQIWRNVRIISKLGCLIPSVAICQRDLTWLRRTQRPFCIVKYISIVPSPYFNNKRAKLNKKTGHNGSYPTRKTLQKPPMTNW